MLRERLRETPAAGTENMEKNFVGNRYILKNTCIHFPFFYSSIHLFIYLFVSVLYSFRLYRMKDITDSGGISCHLKESESSKAVNCFL